MKMLSALKLVAFLSAATSCIHAGNVSMTLDRMHKRLDRALEHSESVPPSSLFKFGGALGNKLQQGPLKFDIQEVNGVKLIKGLVREDSIIDKLFWAKQTDLVQKFQQNFEAGSTTLANLLTKRCMYNLNPVLMFMHEVVLEDEALDRCQRNAIGKEIEQIKVLRATLDALLECVAKALGVNH